MQAAAERFYPQIQKIAKKIARRIPAHVDVDDLIQAGMVGMMKGLKGLDPARGSIDAYLGRRVKGAILDELRGYDPLSRDDRRDSKTVARATRALEVSLGRAPESQEIEERSGLSRDRVQRLRERAGSVRPDSLDDLLGTFSDPTTVDPTDRLADAQNKERLMSAIQTLSQRQQRVLALYYVEELSLKEIGSLLGVTESRVCQIHGEAIRKLRALLGDR